MGWNGGQAHGTIHDLVKVQADLKHAAADGPGENDTAAEEFLAVGREGDGDGVFVADHEGDAGNTAETLLGDVAGEDLHAASVGVGERSGQELGLEGGTDARAPVSHAAGVEFGEDGQDIGGILRGELQCGHASS